MDIKRYDKMPFYFAPAGDSVVSYEDRAIKFLDWLVDAHEEARNTDDLNRNFYQRAVYTYANFLRYQNDTMCNLMFDVQATRPVYARMNATVSQGNQSFYLATGLLHTMAFCGLSYFFRYRRVTTAPALVIGTAYFYFF